MGKKDWQQRARQEADRAASRVKDRLDTNDDGRINSADLKNEEGKRLLKRAGVAFAVIAILITIIIIQRG